MTFSRSDPAQQNLTDGTIFVYDVRPDGMYVTVRGNDPDDLTLVPLILSFGPEDIGALRNAIRIFDGNQSEFCHYAEPQELESGIAVGLGTDSHNMERIALWFNGGEVHLDSEQAADLIASLANALGVMGGP
jgi:hypothetical protein